MGDQRVHHRKKSVEDCLSEPTLSYKSGRTHVETQDSKTTTTDVDYNLGPHARAKRHKNDHGVSGDDPDEIDVYVELKKLPTFSELNKQVQAVVSGASWWKLYGRDWFDMLAGVPAFFIGLLLLRDGGLLGTSLGIFVMSTVHAIWSLRGGHLAVHSSLGPSELLNRFIAEFFVAFTGGFSCDLGYDIHIKSHHPHTNIIGLGDSSTWKQPFLGAHVYMYLAPILVPVMMPLVAIQDLIQMRNYRALAKFSILSSAGVVFYTWLIMALTGYSLFPALAINYVVRAFYAIPYIHVNIFQHIGLPMYSQQNKPVRLYQMATGVLNLASNPLLNLAFGHSLISCHVEHHLFSRLSDHMCLEVKPLVRDYFRRHGLPYQEADYMERLSTFTRRYNEYMVKAPPITKFVGIQWDTFVNGACHPEWWLAGLS